MSSVFINNQVGAEAKSYPDLCLHPQIQTRATARRLNKFEHSLNKNSQRDTSE